jgi:hypothetical protein
MEHEEMCWKESGRVWNRLRNTSIMIKSPDRMDKRKTNVQFSIQISLVWRSVSIFAPESRKKCLDTCRARTAGKAVI